MNKFSLLYFFDPLCGWCYASAPALSAINKAYPNALIMMPSGLFSDQGSRLMTEEWAEHAWSNDQYIEKITGQRFSSEYLNNILRGKDLQFDSGFCNRAIIAIAEIAPELQAILLSHLQIHRYIVGEDTSDVNVVSRITKKVAKEVGIHIATSEFKDRLVSDTALIQATDKRIMHSNSYMQKLGIKGIPQFVIEVNEKYYSIASEILYQGDKAIMNEIERISAQS